LISARIELISKRLKLFSANWVNVSFFSSAFFLPLFLESDTALALAAASSNLCFSSLSFSFSHKVLG
jgi:hypothetical protein